MKRVADAGMLPALALSPDTPVEAVLPFVPALHMVLVMSVHPGFGGQSFMPEVLPKVSLTGRCGSWSLASGSGAHLGCCSSRAV